MEEKIFTFIEQPSTIQRFSRVVVEAYQELRTDPKKFITNLFTKDPNLAKRRQHLKVGLAGAVFFWLLGTIIYTGVYFWQPKELDEPEQLQVLTKLVAIPPTVKPKLPPVKADKRAHGGGSGGNREMSPPPKGRLPIAELINPMVRVTTHPPEIKNPSLPIPPTINVQPDLIPKQDLTIPIGMPTGVPGPPSDGIGEKGGIGNKCCGGVGYDGKGNGYGPGKGGNTGGGDNTRGGSDDIYTPSMGITLPVINYTQKPRYTEDARKDKIQGQVVLSAVLRRDGTITDIKIVRGLGYGLDEEAIKAAYNIKFVPGSKNGQQINVKVRLEFQFQLL